MAVKSLLSLIQANIEVASGSGILAGMAIARETATGKAVKAVRGEAQAYVGIAADDANTSGVTFIQNDPVGATGIDASGNFIAQNNGWFSSVKRAIGDYKDETVNTTTNLTGNGPKRGIGYFATASTQLLVDTALLTSADGANTDATGIATYAVNDYLTYGGVSAAATTTAGYLVKWLSDGTKIARVDAVLGDSAVISIGSQAYTAQLLQITLL